MTRHALSLFIFSLISSFQTLAQNTFPPTPLVDKHFAYPTGIPYKVDTDIGLVRGIQLGYNLCNSTTENQQSLCQTALFNSIDDFCLWGPPSPDSIIANIEGEMVAWCTKPGRGTRLIPHHALQAVQFIRTPDYIQVVGYINQRKINIAPGDWGGELDPHGADLRGNPMGGLMYSTAFSGDNSTYEQVFEWHNFMGANAFCLKLCDPSRPSGNPTLARRRSFSHCEHRLDRIGCAYNAPTNILNGTFESCLGDSQDPPGLYYTTDSRGTVATLTYTQPPENLGVISTMPYTARVPRSSECVTYKSEEIYRALATVTAAVGETPGVGLEVTDTTPSPAAATTRPANISPTRVNVPFKRAFATACMLWISFLW